MFFHFFLTSGFYCCSLAGQFLAEVTNLPGWKDYLFDDDYPLMPLSQVEKNRIV
jgi:hypothetical protein